MLNFDVLLGISADETFQSHVQVLSDWVISMQVPMVNQPRWRPLLEREFATRGTRYEWIADAFIIQAEQKILGLEKALKFIKRVIPSASIALIG